MRGSTLIAGLLLVIAPTACARSAQEVLASAEPLGTAVCQPDSGPFTLNIDNPYLPFSPGHRTVLEGKDGGRDASVEITVLNDTETIAGVETRVVEERESIEGRIVEISRNYIVQAADGTVCYYGEEVDDYANGELVGHGGAWKVGENGAQAGILMPASPEVGTSYQQEKAPGVAEDAAVIRELDSSVTVPAGTFSDTVVTEDVDPLGGGIDQKVYARDIGLIVDEGLKLVLVEM